MHVLNDRICNNSVKNCTRHLNFCLKMTHGMSTETCYTKLIYLFISAKVLFRYVSTRIYLILAMSKAEKAVIIVKFDI